MCGRPSRLRHLKEVRFLYLWSIARVPTTVNCLSAQMAWLALWDNFPCNKRHPEQCQRQNIFRTSPPPHATTIPRRRGGQKQAPNATFLVVGRMRLAIVGLHCPRRSFPVSRLFVPPPHPRYSPTSPPIPSHQPIPVVSLQLLSGQLAAGRIACSQNGVCWFPPLLHVPCHGLPWEEISANAANPIP